MRRALALVAVALALPGAAHAQAPDAVTPDGAATLVSRFNGPVPAIAYGPRAVVAFSLTVGPGSEAGPVRLRTTTGRGTPDKASPTVTLPAEPGTHRFALNPGLALPTGGFPVFGLDQEVGGHTILQRAQSDWVLDVLRGGGTESRDGDRLALGVEYENDRDEDGLGDKSQDIGDLKLVEATVEDGIVTVRFRNAGTSTRNVPWLPLRDRNDAKCLDETSPRPTGFWEPGCVGPPLAPGATGTLRVEFSEEPPAEMTVASEGETDLTPDDNTGPVLLPLRVAVGRVRAVGGALRVSAKLNREVPVTITARVAGMTLRRTLAAGRTSALLRPESRAKRRRLARVLRGRATVRVTIAAGEEESTRRIVLRG